ncbi:TolC family protein [Qingshengfaniella alkalisoli]|nr:TolC family protein [Qingshengfaniella alkalisoli]
MTIYATTIAFLVGLAVAGAAQADITLRDAVRISAERDPNVTAMRQRVARRTVDIRAARDEYYPSLSLQGDTNTTDVDGANVTLTVSQVLYDWGMIQSKIEAASQERVKSVSDLKSAVEELTLQMSELFIEVEVLGLKIARTRDYTAFAQRVTGHAERRAAGGLGDNAEVARARLETARAEDQLSQLEGDLRIALAQIEFLAGIAPGNPAAAPELNFGARYGQAGKLASAVKLAPDYIAARAEKDAANAGIKTAKASRLPTITLQAQGRQDLDGGRSRTAIGIAAGMDLDSASLGARQIQAARLELEAATSSMAAVEQDLLNEGQNALERLQILRANESSRERQLVQAQQVLDSYEQQFAAGQRDLIDLLTTGRDLYDAQIDAINTFDTRKRTEYEAAEGLGVLGTLILAAGATQ